MGPTGEQPECLVAARRDHCCRRNPRVITSLPRRKYFSFAVRCSAQWVDYEIEVWP